LYFLFFAVSLPSPSPLLPLTPAFPCELEAVEAEDDATVVAVGGNGMVLKTGGTAVARREHTHIGASSAHALGSAIVRVENFVTVWFVSDFIGVGAVDVVGGAVVVRSVVAQDT